ncbi:MAG: hypothetical protein WBN75_09780 [Verrucomicrobiia bacterium]|jgi:hypothetical protein
MKVFAPILAIIFSFRAVALTSLEDISPHLSTNAQIIWQAPTNHLPKSIWIYKKLPRVFSVTTISNAIVLASFRDKGFPKPSTNRVVIWDNRTEGEPQPPYFEITPENGEMSYSLGDRAPDSPQEIFKDEAAVDRAWERLAQLGIDRSQLVKTNVASYGVYGVFFPRQIDGIQFYDESEGFSFQQYGSHGKIRNFSVTLPNLQREQNSPTASAQQIIACIRAFKTPSPPNGEEPDYFGRIKNLAKATKLTITKITPYYGEGIYGETPTNNEPSRFVSPIAELEAVADFGNSNTTVRLLSPIISSDVKRLLKTK